MKTTKVELPDGRLVVLEGSDEGAANLLANHYLKQSQAVEEALPVPGLHPVSGSGIVPSHRCETPGPAITSNEEPMEMPAMTFSKTDALVVSKAAPDAEEAMLMPAMRF
jgi:hypothetical protein